MSSFTDTLSRRWDVDVNVGAVKRVRSMCGVNIYDVMDTSKESLAERISTDPVLLVDVLYALCAPQAEKRGIPADRFAEGFQGDVLDEAADALLEGIAFFFPAAKRKLMLAALKEIREEKARMEEQVDTLVRQGLPAAASGLPTPSGSSTPAPGPAE